MDPDTEVQFDCSPLLRLYKSGRIERCYQNVTAPAAFDAATGVTSRDVTINPNVSARLYLPRLPSSDTDQKLPILVYIHGGGFCIESAFSPTYQNFLTTLSSRANLLVVSVEYRLAPEHLLPAAYDDSWAALDWVFGPSPDTWLTNHGDFRHVFLAGDSAGANIAHQMALRASAAAGDVRRIQIEGMVLIHPYFWGADRIPGESTDPGLLGLLERLWKVVNKPEAGDLDDPTMNPLVGGGARLGELACERMMVCVAEKDGLAARGKAYYEAVVGSKWGGEAELVVSEGVDHVFYLGEPGSDRAVELMDKLVGFFKIRD